MTRQTLLGLGIDYEVFQSHSDTPQSVGLLWTSDRPVAETSTWSHTPLTRVRDPWPRRNSNPQDPRLRPPGHCHRLPGELTARKSDRGMTSTIQPHLVWSVRMSGYVRLLALYASLRKQRQLYLVQCRCLNKTQKFWYCTTCAHLCS
jgi:hypothetical protein